LDKFYCPQANLKLSGDFTSDVADVVLVRFERCSKSDPKVKCWSSVRRNKFIGGKVLRLIATKNFFK